MAIYCVYEFGVIEPVVNEELSSVVVIEAVAATTILMPVTWQRLSPSMHVRGRRLRLRGSLWSSSSRQESLEIRS